MWNVGPRLEMTDGGGGIVDVDRAAQEKDNEKEEEGEKAERKGKLATTTCPIERVSCFAISRWRQAKGAATME